MVLKSVENRLERIFEKTFSRTFKSTLQPIEIGTRIVREVDLTRRLSSQGPISPNQIRVWLGPVDAARFDGFQKALVSELEETVRQHAISEGFSFVGPVKVEVFIDDDIKPGNLEVKTEFLGGESQPRLIASDGRTFNVGERATGHRSQPGRRGRDQRLQRVATPRRSVAHQRRRGHARPPVHQRNVRERPPGHRRLTVAA